jgi:hypothetical protein
VSPTNDYITATFRVSQSVGLYIWIYSRQIINALFGNPVFADKMTFSPEKLYADPDCKIHVYHKVHTGDWWCKTQVCRYFHHCIKHLFLLNSCFDLSRLT